MYKIKNISGSQRVVDVDGKRHYINPRESIECMNEIDLPENLFKIEKVKKNGESKSLE